MIHQERAKDHGGTVEYIELGHLRGAEIEQDANIHTIEFVETGSAESSHDKEKKHDIPLSSARDLVTEILAIEDDPTLNPWTFRMWFIGIGISIFTSMIMTLSTFRPQPVLVNTVFVVVISYVMGVAMHKLLPSKGFLGKILNPGPFNKKEHSAICIMTAAAGSLPEAMQILAVQKLFYNMNPHPAVGIFLVISTQMIGYGVAGLLRTTLVYPSKMLYPANIPVASLLENLHRDHFHTKKKMKVFYICFAVLFVWQALPQYIMPVLSGISIFCLANKKNMFMTNLFGGTMANEGLGTLAFSFDWSMITAGGNPLWMPLQTLLNSLLGYLLSIGLFMGLYYGNVWNAKQFPFLSPMMFSEKSTSKRYVMYNQTAILDKEYRVQESLLAISGLPRLTSSHTLAMIVRNIGITAAISHMTIWHWKDIKSAFAFLASSNLRKLFQPKSWDLNFWKHKPKAISQEEATAICPHYALMQAYDEVPSWWFGATWVIFTTIGLITSILASSTLPAWAYFTAIFIAASSVTFFAALTAMFGFPLFVQPLIQMIGAYMVPGLPLANMYFAMFGFNSLAQTQHLLKDLKLGQYFHLAPKCTFAMQLFGSLIGCITSYGMMQKITTEKKEILLSIQGTNIWSGQMLQSQNTQAVGWGGLAKYMYSPTARYAWVSWALLLGLIAPVPFWIVHKWAPKLRLDYWNTAIITSAMAMLDHGTHSALMFHYLLGFFSQFWLRKYKSATFIKYNYIASSGLDGGAALISFILIFAVFGAGGKVFEFPPYWGNNYQKGNYDFCMRDPALGPKRAH